MLVVLLPRCQRRALERFVNGERHHSPILLSVIIPIHDEVGSIPTLAAEVGERLGAAGLGWEAIWVDDGSRDGSVAVLRALPPPHRFLSLDRNHGVSAAYRAGFAVARGDWLATLDGDGQNDPADIPRLLDAALEQAADYVGGIRTFRRDHLLRRLSSRIANRVRDLVTGVRIRDAGCANRLLRRTLVRHFPAFHNDYVYFPIFTVLNGGKYIELPVNHRPRIAGRAHFGVNNRLWAGIMDLIGVCWLMRRHRNWRVAEQQEGHLDTVTRSPDTEARSRSAR